MDEKKIQLRDKLDKVYSDIKLRKSPSAWQKVLKDAVIDDIYGANITTIDFLTTHKYLPMKVWRTLGGIFNWENNRSSLSELFTKSTIDKICSNMTKKLPVRIEHIPESLGADTDKYITYLLMAREYIFDNQLVQASLLLGAARKMYAKHPDIALLEGEYAIKKYDFARAERILERLSSVDGENGDALLPLAITYSNLGSLSKAERYFKSAYLFDCDERRLAIESGKHFCKAEKKIFALSGYIQFLRKNPYDEEVQTLLKDLAFDIIREYERKPGLKPKEKKMLAGAFLCIRQNKKALEVSSPIDKSYFHDIPSCLLAGHLLWLSGNNDAAERFYHKCSSLARKETKGLFYLGEIKASKGHMHEAVACFEKALSINIRSYPAYLALAKRYIKSGDFQNVDYMANILIRANADMANAYVLKGLVMENRGEEEEALRFYDLAIETDKRLEVAHKKKCELLKTLGRSDVEDALMYMKECNTIRDILFPRVPQDEAKKERIILPETVRELIKSGEELLESGKLPEAYYNISKAYAIDPENKYVSFRMGMILYIMERFIESKEILEKVKDFGEYSDLIKRVLEDITTALGTMKKKDVQDRAVLAQYYYDAGKRKSCAALLEEIESEGEMSAECDVLAGKCAIAFNRVQQADKYFQSAIKKAPQMVEVVFFEAMTLQAMGRFDEAMEYYNKAIKMSEGDTAKDVYTGKLSLLYGVGKYEEAISEWKKISHIFNKPSDINGYAGLSYYKLGEYDEAEKQLKYAIDSGSDSTELFRIRCMILNEMGRYNEALDCCDKGLDINNESAGLLYQKATSLYALGKNRQGERINQTSLEVDPNYDESYYLMGKMFADKHMYREAIESFSKAMEKSPGNEKYCMCIAESLMNIGKNKEATAYYSEAIAKNPENREAYLKRAVLYNMADRDEDALEDLKKVMDKNPNDPDCLLALADILSQYEYVEIDDKSKSNREDEMLRKKNSDGEEDENSGIIDITDFNSLSDENEKGTGKSKSSKKSSSSSKKGNASKKENGSKDDEQTEDNDYDVFSEFPEDAEYYYTRAIESKEGFFEAYISRGKYYVQCNKFDMAINDFSKAIELDKQSTEGWMQRGITELFMGEYKAAIDDFDNVISINETYISAYNYMVKCYNALYNYETAIKVADAGLSANSEFLYLKANRAVAYYHTQRYQEAMKDLNDVLGQQNRINTDTVENSYKYRGMCFEVLNDTQKAVLDYIEAEKYDPDNVDIRYRINKLSKGKAKSHKFFGKKRGAK